MKTKAAPEPITYPDPEPATEREAQNRAAARAAHLHYSTDDVPGIRREKEGDGFRYYYPDGSEVTDAPTLARLNAIAFPPAYTEAWFCPDPRGHLQASGRDAKGRKQYRYHAEWRDLRDETKYHRMTAFGDALPAMRGRVNADLSRRGLPREKVLATVVRLLETTRMRVGNEQYARENHHYGLTTLRNRHVAVDGDTVHFAFVGKAGISHTLDLANRKLARIVQKCRELPGQALFEYVDGETGMPRPVHSGDVNDYLREISGEPFTAKDFRTWAGTVLCAMELAAFENAETKKAAQANVAAAIAKVAKNLGNTPSVCRKCYIHPAVLSAYDEGVLRDVMGSPGEVAAREEEAGAGRNGTGEGRAGILLPEERAVLRFLRGVGR